MSETIHIHYVFILPDRAERPDPEPMVPDAAQRLSQYFSQPFPEDEGGDRPAYERRPYPPGPFMTWDAE